MMREDLDDEFSYLGNKEKAIEYFKKQNKVSKKYFKDQKELVNSLFDDVKSRVGDYESLHVDKGDFEYYYKTFSSKQYPIIYRKKDGKERVLLDQNKLASNSTSLSVAYVKVSDNHKLLAYGYNLDGTDTYTLVVKDLSTENKVIKVEDLGRYFEWFDDKEFLVTKQNDSLRPFQVYKYDLRKNKTLIFEEENEKAFVFITRSKDKTKIMINSYTKETNEVRIYDGTLSLFRARESKHQYFIESWFNDYIVLSNKENPEFDLFIVKNDMWKKVMSPNKGKLNDFNVFENFVVVSELYEFEKLRVLNIKTLKEHSLEFDDKPYCLENFDYHNFFTDEIIVSYSTLIHPIKHYRFNLLTQKKVLIKEDSKPNYSPKDYAQQRIYIGDIPVSICYKKEFKESNDCLLTGYGSYGSVWETYFSSSRIALLNQGFKFAVAHVRGGGELGEKWYKDGKLLNKKNTFNDFIKVSKYLRKAGIKNLAISGRSAGGLLMGAVINKQPSLFDAVIAGVPFVDVLNTMLDASIPLTTVEYEEWGNPNDKEYFDYIKSYSPYDNVSKKVYPPILITTSLNDTRVSYKEPAKWHAKLKKHNTSDKPVILQTDLKSGHSGNTSRDDSIKETCRDYAFVINEIRKK